MNKYFKLALVFAAMAAAITGCSSDGDSPSNKTPAQSGDAFALSSVTINGAPVDIGFYGTAGFSGEEGWGFFSNGAQNGGIYSTTNAADLATVTVVATPQDSGATVSYAFIQYTGEHPGTGGGNDPEYQSPADSEYTTSGVFSNVADQSYIAVKVTKGDSSGYYKFRVAVNAPVLGADGVSAGGAKLGWTIPDLDWTHNQGAYFHNQVGPVPEQSIGLVLQDTTPLAGKTLSVDAPAGATATWAILSAGNNNTGVTAASTWNPLSQALPSAITSGSLLSVKVSNASKTLYYNWWLYEKAAVKLSALSVAGNVVEAAKLVTFADSWSGADIQEIVVPVDGDLLENAKIAWTEPLGMGMSIAVTNGGGGGPIADDWLGTTRGQNDSYQVVVQPPAVDLTSGQILTIRARISKQVWYYRAKITFRSPTASDADLTRLTVGGVVATSLGTAGANVQAATAGTIPTLNLSQATGAAIAPVGGPLAEFLYIKGTNATTTPSAAATWQSSGTLSFDNGEYLIIQAFVGELPSKYYKFLVSVTYPNTADVKLSTLSIGGGQVTEANWGTPGATAGAATAGTLEINEGQNTSRFAGTVPAAAAGSTIKYAKTNGAEPATDAWQEAAAATALTFAPSGEVLWVRVAAGTQTIKIYKINITVRPFTDADAVLSAFTITGELGSDYQPTYTVSVSSLGTPNATPGSVVAGSFSIQAGKQGFPPYVPGLYVNLTVPGGVSVHFAKAENPPTTDGADTGWTSGAAGPYGAPSLEFGTANTTLWVRVKAGSFIKYYKFAVTVTPAS